jgi:hypothetical protein
VVQEGSAMRQMQETFHCYFCHSVLRRYRREDTKQHTDDPKKQVKGWLTVLIYQSISKPTKECVHTTPFGTADTQMTPEILRKRSPCTWHEKKLKWYKTFKSNKSRKTGQGKKNRRI